MHKSELISGIVLCIESAVNFQTDAVSLYENARYASACILSTIALEQLGQCRYLWSTFTRSTDSESVDEEKLRRGLRRRHEQKIRDGMYSFTGHVPTGIALREGSPQEEIERHWKIFERLQNRAPARFHAVRAKAQYLSLESAEWNQPQQITVDEARDLLLNVGNNLGPFLSFVVPGMPEVKAALESIGKSDLITGPRHFWPLRKLVNENSR